MPCLRRQPAGTPVLGSPHAKANLPATCAEVRPVEYGNTLRRMTRDAFCSHYGPKLAEVVARGLFHRATTETELWKETMGRSLGSYVGGIA